MSRRIVAAGVILAAVITGCSSDPLAEYAGTEKPGYVSADGANTELPPSAREEPIEFSGTSVSGETITSSDLIGEVYVVNFWYAGCPPCRVEAPDLKAISERYSDITFLGVNTRDGEANAARFEEEFGIEYPSILDARTAELQLAFAGSVAPNAVPTTIVVDREGRVAARISGVIAERSILAGMIDTVVAEGS